MSISPPAFWVVAFIARLSLRFEIVYRVLGVVPPCIGSIACFLGSALSSSDGSGWIPRCYSSPFRLPQSHSLEVSFFAVRRKFATLSCEVNCSTPAIQKLVNLRETSVSLFIFVLPVCSQLQFALGGGFRPPRLWASPRQKERENDSYAHLKSFALRSGIFKLFDSELREAQRLGFGNRQARHRRY